MYTDEYVNMSEELAEAIQGLSGLSTGMNLFSNMMSIAAYVLLALGLYTIAKRRDIKNPWLAWVPLANVWILGCISDQYQFVVNGRQKGKRKALLIMSILMFILMIVIIACAAGVFINVFSQMDNHLGALNEDMFLDDPSYMTEAIGPMLGMIGAVFIMMGIAIALVIVEYMAYYDLFASCEPNNKALYLTLGIVGSFFGLPLLAVFVFICRNKDLGMPPRRDQIPQPNDWQPPQANEWNPNYNVGWQPAQPNNWQPEQPQVDPEHWEDNKDQ